MGEIAAGQVKNNQKFFPMQLIHLLPYHFGPNLVTWDSPLNLK
jgi:hypothetical protein